MADVIFSSLMTSHENSWAAFGCGILILLFDIQSSHAQYAANAPAARSLISALLVHLEHLANEYISITLYSYNHRFSGPGPQVRLPGIPTQPLLPLVWTNHLWVHSRQMVVDGVLLVRLRSLQRIFISTFLAIAFPRRIEHTGTSIHVRSAVSRFAQP